MSDSDLVEIRARIPTKTHDFIRKRALRTQRDEVETAGDLLRWAVLELIKRSFPMPKPGDRVYTQQELDNACANARRTYEVRIRLLQQRIVELEHRQ